MERIFSIRYNAHQHDDIKKWVINILDELFGLQPYLGAKSEVFLGEGWGSGDIMVEEPILIEIRKSLDDELSDVQHHLQECFRTREDLNIGIATDGIHWRFYARTGDNIHEYYQFAVKRNWNDDKLRQEIYDSVTPLRHVAPKPVTAQELANSFGLQTPKYELCKALLFSIADSSSTFEDQLKAWIAEYREVYPDFGELCEELGLGDEQKGALELHIQYAYFTILVKIIAQVLVLGDRSFTEEMRNRPKDVALGRLLEEAGIRSVESDECFTWISEGPISDLNQLLKEIFRTLLRYDLSTIGEDIYPSLYEEIVNSQIRHRL